uniref:Methyltransf_11 domain-containing protein n=1 Tax=Strongyloides papillosus TaxID=174720 RepID=A0A0N5CDB3_STREA
MNKIVKKLFTPYINDIASEIAFPTKSFSADVIRKIISIKSKPLNKTAIDQFSPQDGDNYLELGFGRGDGLKLFYESLRSKEINAKLFGIEGSTHALDKALHRFALEISEDKIVLEKSYKLGLLPFPNDFFNGIYHVDVFYYWSTLQMPKIERELYRILKPNCQLVCTMDLNRLRMWEKWNLISSNDYDIMRYVEFLEPCGFEDVKIKYINVDKNREIQLITARKPEQNEDYNDPDKKFKELEEDIKYHMFAEKFLNKDD